MPLNPYRHARQVFDECDTLRETYWELQVRGEKRRAAKVKEEAKALLATLGLDSSTGSGETLIQDEIDLQWSYTKGEEAAEHNRWANVRPWDHAMLPEPYLNASTVPPLVSGPSKDLKTLPSYVASQAPLPTTLPTFWHHFLSSGALLLVNLTPVYDAYGLTKVRKSHQYWPDEPGVPFDAGDGWTVELVSQTKHTTRLSPAATAGSSGEQSSSTTALRPGASNCSGSHTLNGKLGNSSDNLSTGRRAVQSERVEPEQDWVIVKRQLHIHPPAEWKAAPLASYMDALYNSTGMAAAAAAAAAAPPPSHPIPTVVDRANSDGSGWDVTLLHVDAWADGGADSGLNFCRLVDLIQETQSRTCPATTYPVPPIWVHCSAGIGRTGTLIAGMLARSLLLESQTPSIQTYPTKEMVLSIWRYLRQRRYGMITTPQQAMMVADEIERIKRGRE